eukprot:comp19738_c0_seq2/m.23541 comp19738_c0_seq2/g.23541  ORF comp19738_c0_seq2/g.23541 comp19738_c0_seq2/m.23541 type:complete len:405 (-) comp19738_c0_seq2:645-1859(-)
MVYGFTIALHEYMATIPTLWNTTMKYMQERGGSVPGSWMNYFTDDGVNYNGHHFWSNFEIGSVKFFSGKEYQDYFDFLDRSGGFFYERWGDAPVHSLGVGLYARHDQIHWFNEIGYYHGPWAHCPTQPQLLKKCDCQKQRQVDDIPFSSMYDFHMLPAKTMAENRREMLGAVDRLMVEIQPKDPTICQPAIKVSDGGEWFVCDKPALSEICTVYSFSVRGASEQLSFELEAQKKGCTVYYFNQWRNPHDMLSIINEYDRQVLYGLHWHQYTLSDVDADGLRRDSDTAMAINERRLATLMDMFGHGDSVLDVVKFDVEGDEWLVLTDLAASGVLGRVKHLMFEVHLRKEKLWKYPEHLPVVLSMLSSQQFELVFSSQNPYSTVEDVGGRQLPCCFKLVYRNRAYL